MSENDAEDLAVHIVAVNHSLAVMSRARASRQQLRTIVDVMKKNPEWDLVVVDERAEIRMPFVSLGTCAEAGSSWLLPERVGPQQASWLMLSGAPLSAQDIEDVAAYFSHRRDGLPPVAGEGAPESGRSLRQRDPSIRLVFAGDPERGIPPCAACHGPGAQKLGAPPLRGQHIEYIESQLGAFAQGMRQNDINEQMRVIAHELTPGEMHALAVYYGAADHKK